MPDQRNMFLAIFLSMTVLIVWHFLVEVPLARQRAEQQRILEQEQQDALLESGGDAALAGDVPAPAGAPDLPSARAGAGATPPPPGAVGDMPTAPGQSPVAASPATDRASTLANTPRVTIRTDRVEGSIALTGGMIDDLVLRDYHDTVEADSPNIVLLSPLKSENPYFIDHGWVAGPHLGQPLPNLATPWTADRRELTLDQPVTLRWDNGNGLIFERNYSIDSDYMMSVTQRVVNHSGQPVTLYPYARVQRVGTPVTTGLYILHEGPLGVMNEVLEAVDYSEVVEEKSISHQTPGGWIGMTDKYWLVALVPDQKDQHQMRFTAPGTMEGKQRYMVDYRGGAVTIAAGGTASTTNQLFAGAKEVNLLDGYGDTYGIPLFDHAIDWGWFYFLTRPIFLALHYLYGFIGNFGVAIILLTIAIKLLLYPLADKSYRSMSKMKLLQPKMNELRERYGEDKAKMNQELMELYKREKINPAAGCLPILVQIPVFFALYKVLYVSIEMRQAPFFGWIQDLSAPDPTSFANLFGLLPFDPPQFLAIGAWPLIMGGTMFLQQKLNPQPTDPVQAQIFMFMPLMFMVLLAQFPAGLVIYWTLNNVLSIGQQWLIMRRSGAA